MGNETTPPTSETPVVDPQSETLTTPVTSGETQDATPSTNASAEDALKELESLKAAYKKVQQEAKEHRLKAKELDDLKAKIEEQNLTEKQKLEKRVAELQSQNDLVTRQAQERTVNYEVQLQAAQLGIADPSDAVKLLDWSSLDYDDDGRPTNVKTLLTELLKAKPYLAGKASGSAALSAGGATNPGRATTGAPPVLSWEVIGKMTSQEYAARHTEIQAWIRANPARFGQRLTR